MFPLSACAQSSIRFKAHETTKFETVKCKRVRPIVKVLTLKKGISISQRFGILVVLCLNLNLRKNGKNLFSSFLVMWKYLRKNVILGPLILHGLCLIGYQSVNRR